MCSLAVTVFMISSCILHQKWQETWWFSAALGSIFEFSTSDTSFTGNVSFELSSIYIYSSVDFYSLEHWQTVYFTVYKCLQFPLFGCEIMVVEKTWISPEVRSTYFRADPAEIANIWTNGKHKHEQGGIITESAPCGDCTALVRSEQVCCTKRWWHPDPNIQTL